MKYIKRIKYLCFVAFLLLAACTPMDDKYSDFVKDGPITYIAKQEAESVTVSSGRNRIGMSWPKSNDPRGKKAIVYWSNKAYKFEVDINPEGITSFIIDNLDEGSYIFEIIIFDDQGNSSISTTVTGEVYGDNYEAYLINRPISEVTFERLDTVVFFQDSKDKTVVNTEIEWKQDGQSFSVVVDSSQFYGILPGFKAMSFRYRTTYEPGPLDQFLSPYAYYTSNVKPEDIIYDRGSKTFTFPANINDGNWVGFEMKWVDRFTFEEKSKIIEGTNVVTIPEYESAEFTYTTLYRFDDVDVVSSVLLKTTAARQDFDRSVWNVEPETDKESGLPIDNVNHKTSVADKNKSPYLSHLLPWNNTAITSPNQSNQDALNSPRAHIDDNPYSYLSMVKGKGTGIIDDAGNSEGVDHSNGGVISDGTEVYFIIDLSAQIEEYDYFRIHYRIAGGSANLKPQKVSFFGSDDPACITDKSKFQTVRIGVDLPESTTAPTATSGNNTGNVSLPPTTYRFLKMRFDAWTSASNTMQITDFFIGGTVY